MDDYYPFGLSFNSWQRGGSKKNDYLYNGFEEQTELDWGVFDYQARYYDPAIGRFLMIDPMADVSRRNGVYNYAYNNPLRYIDPDGMVATDTTGAGGNTPPPDDSNTDGNETYLDDVEMDNVDVEAKPTLLSRLWKWTKNTAKSTVEGFNGVLDVFSTAAAGFSNAIYYLGTGKAFKESGNLAADAPFGPIQIDLEVEEEISISVETNEMSGTNMSQERSAELIGNTVGVVLDQTVGKFTPFSTGKIVEKTIKNKIATYPIKKGIDKTSDEVRTRINP